MFSLIHLHFKAPASVPASAPQPCLGIATSAADTAHPEVTLEGWHKMWESGPNGLTSADITWLKEDAERGLFPRAMSYKDKHGSTRWRKVLKDNRMWFHPPEFPEVVEGKIPSADPFIARLFSGDQLECSVTAFGCPRSDCSARSSQKALFYRCGYSKTVRQICHMSGWYSILTEVLACNACRKVAKESQSRVPCCLDVTASHRGQHHGQGVEAGPGEPLRGVTAKKGLVQHPPQPVQKTWEDHTEFLPTIPVTTSEERAAMSKAVEKGLFYCRSS
ncbi:uncharacterized protein LOC132113680 [Carassius carassius]|uniref:uncharacterized protein LOC132113680 n=1 Tax=Carassius carassius TaxID=217509 RepID=UPI002868C34D|nr:uncharacterized protein LOC132113680 [Carassius carassius]